jgi:hypothetical protein
MKSVVANSVRHLSLWIVALSLLPTVAFSFGQEPNSGSLQLPDSPGVAQAQPVNPMQLFAGQQASAGLQQKSEPREPVGTAAAAAPVTTGIAASQPAGAAIAPAKQRRVRVLMIKVGAMVGAGAALGAVAALSSASPSRPPGGH